MSSASDVGLTDGTSDTDMEVLEEQVDLAESLEQAWAKYGPRATSDPLHVSVRPV